MHEGLQALTEKEKQALRLMLRGHDAKSIARKLDRSVHTVNDRLRAARRKLSVTSSREAARILLEDEGPEILGHNPLGEVRAADSPDTSDPSNGRHPGARAASKLRGWIIGGCILMSLILALALAAAMADRQPMPDSPPEQVALDHATEDAARAWLALVDASDWSASFAAAGKQFQEQNTVAGWEAASQAARVPLGAVIGREAIAYQSVNAPPHGYRVVQFRSDFANRKDVTESVTLEQEDGGGGWKVVGYFID
jgi:DNA-binding CsgD family transcriptional regulator